MSGGWLIQGYDGLQRIFRLRVSPVLSDREIEALLQRLVAQHLTRSEIIAGSLRKRMKAYSPNLSVHREQRRRVFSCGSNPHYIASFLTEFEFRDID